MEIRDTCSSRATPFFFFKSSYIKKKKNAGFGFVSKSKYLFVGGGAFSWRVFVFRGPGFTMESQLSTSANEVHILSIGFHNVRPIRYLG